MKRLLIILSVVVLTGCEYDAKTAREQETKVIEVDSCEYVTWSGLYKGGIVHKQNCKYCNERAKK